MATPARRPKNARVESTADSAAVDEFLASLTHPLKREIEALRKIILQAGPRITEGIKWNVPSYHCGEWFATFHLRAKDGVQVILHRGAATKSASKTRYVDDPEGILTWITMDRCAAKFASRTEVTAKAAAFSAIIAAWAHKLRDEIGRH